MKCLILELSDKGYLVENLETNERPLLSESLFRRESPIIGKKYEIDIRGNNARLSLLPDEDAIAAELAIVEASQELADKILG
jgi:hypothetical protein